MFAAITDWAAPDRQRQAELLRRGRCGVIEMADERLVRIGLRPFARRASQIEARTWGRLMHHLRRGNRCWLYYRQPRHLPQFLVLDYVISTRESTLATFRGALNILDGLARLKRSDAILCDVATGRISDRLLARWGWEPHVAGRRHRQFIKRFYGNYPAPATLAAAVLALDEAALAPA